MSHDAGAPPKGMLLALPANIRPGSKGLPETNVIAYWASSSVTKKKSFVTVTPGFYHAQYLSNINFVS